MGCQSVAEDAVPFDPGAKVLERAYREVVVDTGGPAFLVLNGLLESARHYETPVQVLAAAPQWVVTALIPSGAEASADAVKAFTRSLEIVVSFSHAWNSS